MISQVLGIRPWEQRELLTGAELLEACDFIDKVNKEAADAAKGADPDG